MITFICKAHGMPVTAHLLNEEGRGQGREEKKRRKGGWVIGWKASSLSFQMYENVVNHCLKLSEDVPLPSLAIQGILLTLNTTDRSQYLHFDLVYNHTASLYFGDLEVKACALRYCHSHCRDFVHTALCLQGLPSTELYADVRQHIKSTSHIKSSFNADITAQLVTIFQKIQFQGMVENLKTLKSWYISDMCYSLKHQYCMTVLYGKNKLVLFHKSIMSKLVQGYTGVKAFPPLGKTSVDLIRIILANTQKEYCMLSRHWLRISHRAHGTLKHLHLIQQKRTHSSQHHMEYPLE